MLLLGVGAIVALLMGQKRLEIYENGIEIFNFPLAPSPEPERLSRAMHPILLARMSDFLSTLTDAPFSCVTPFVFHTKAEIVQAARNRLPEERILRTVSCMRLRAVPCGSCSGCLLRRVALFCNGLDDTTSRYRFDILTGNRVAGLKTPMEQLERETYATNAGIYRLKKALADANPHRAFMHLSGVNFCDRAEFLSAISRIGESPQEAAYEQLLDLYRRYAKEWERMRPAIRILPPLGIAS